MTRVDVPDDESFLEKSGDRLVAERFFCKTLIHDLTKISRTRSLAHQKTTRSS